MSGKCDESICPVPEGYLSYAPSQVGNGIILGLFIILISITIFFGFRYRTTMFSILFFIGTAFELLCYAGRLLLHCEPKMTSYFIMFLLGSSIGPTFLAGGIFCVLAKVMGIYDSDLLEIRPQYFTHLFFAVSLLALPFQVVGITYTGAGPNRVEIGEGMKFLAGGFAIHVGAFLLFFISYFWFLAKKHQRAGRLNPENAYIYEAPRFKFFLIGWQVAAWLMFIRTVYRLVETLDGLSSPLFQSEAAFMVADGTQVLIATIILTALHPGRVFGGMWAQREQLPCAIPHEKLCQKDHPYSPRRAPVPAQLPLAHSNKYPLHHQCVHLPPSPSPTQVSPYQDSPNHTPKSGLPATNSHATADQSNRMTYKSTKSAETRSSTQGSRRSPKPAGVHDRMVDNNDLW